MKNIYEDMALRTGGNIYIGVVGPVRTGKSTLIKRIMEQLVIPNIDDPYRRERARDELPQSGSGKMIMTSEPKFVPEEAVEISPDGTSRLRVRMIDSVGYMIPGATGAEEDGIPRMVTTPWFDQEIPMTEAAELGTKKVMEEHCSIGLVVTTDGSITDIPRADYVDAECRAIADMRATGKPFMVIINSRNPDSAAQLKTELQDKYQVSAITADCQALDERGILQLLEQLLYSFPIRELRIFLPRWMEALEHGHPVKEAVYQALLSQAEQIKSLGEAGTVVEPLRQLPQIKEVYLKTVDLGRGCVSLRLEFPESLFYEILSSKTGVSIENDAQLLSLLSELVNAKREYEKIADALSSVKATGYGIVMPTAEEIKLETPEILRKGSTYGVKLKAGAPSIHMIRVDIDTEISPMVGDEKQSQDMIAYLSGEEPQKLWESNIFGKSVYELIQEGLASKLIRTPEEVRTKFRGSLNKIVNDGAAGLICLIL